MRNVVSVRNCGIAVIFSVVHGPQRSAALVTGQWSMVSGQWSSHGCSSLRWCVLRCLARWSEREKLLSQTRHTYGRTPECERQWRASSSDLENVHAQPGHEQANGFSPVWRRTCAFRCELLLYDLRQPVNQQVCTRSPAPSDERCPPSSVDDDDDEKLDERRRRFRFLDDPTSTSRSVHVGGDDGRGTTAVLDGAGTSLALTAGSVVVLYAAGILPSERFAGVTSPLIVGDCDDDDVERVSLAQTFFQSKTSSLRPLSDERGADTRSFDSR